jgi:hypothetical protein
MLATWSTLTDVTGTVASDFEGAAYTQIEARFLVRTGTNSGTPELFCAGNTFASAQPIHIQYVSFGLTYGGMRETCPCRLRYLSASAIDLCRDCRSTLVQGCQRQNMPRDASGAIDANGPSATYTDCAGEYSRVGKQLYATSVSETSLRCVTAVVVIMMDQSTEDAV